MSQQNGTAPTLPAWMNERLPDGFDQAAFDLAEYRNGHAPDLPKNGDGHIKYGSHVAPMPTTPTTPTTLTEAQKFGVLRRHLHRGGSYAYLWACSEDRNPKTNYAHPMVKTSYWYHASQEHVAYPNPIDTAGHHINLYFGVHPTGKKGPHYLRSGSDPTKESPCIVAANCFYAEFDAKDFDDDLMAENKRYKAHLKAGRAVTAFEGGLSPDKGLEMVRAHIAGLELQPSAIVASGGGLQAYWFFDETILFSEFGFERFKRLQAQFVAAVGADEAAKDLIRVLRVPGSLNQKRCYAGAPLRAAFELLEPQRLYSVERLERFIRESTPSIFNQPASTARPAKKAPSKPAVSLVRQVKEYPACANDIDPIEYDKAIVALKRLNQKRCDDWDKWVSVGLALFHEFGGKASALALYDVWSQGSEKYEVGACEARWNTFQTPSDSSKALGLGSLIKWANEDSQQARRHQKALAAPVRAATVAKIQQLVSRLSEERPATEVGGMIKGVIGDAGRMMWQEWAASEDEWGDIEPVADGVGKLTAWADEDSPPYVPPVAEFTLDEILAIIEEEIEAGKTKDDLFETSEKWAESASFLSKREQKKVFKALRRGKVTKRDVKLLVSELKDFVEDRELEAEEHKAETAQSEKESVMIMQALTSLGYSFRLNDCNDSVEINSVVLDSPLAAKIRMQMADRGFKSVRMIEDTYLAYAYDARYHPVKDYLRSLRGAWDGMDHIGWLADHVEDTHQPVVCDDCVTRSLFHLYLRRWLVGSVAKVFGDGQSQNGCIVLDGPQGIGKSYMIKWLAQVMPDYFIEDEVNPNNKDHQLRLTTNWLCEIAELGSTTRKSDIESLKSFLTRGHVKVRPPYGRQAIRKPAITSFFGTINNEDGFLRDRTGNRRFWVVSIKSVDRSYSKKIDPAQIWAQAVALYLRGDKGDLRGCEKVVRDQINESYEVASPVLEWVFKHFEQDPSSWAFTSDIVETLQMRGYRATTRSLQMNLSTALRSHGFKKDTIKNRSAYWGLRKIEVEKSAVDQPFYM